MLDFPSAPTNGQKYPQPPVAGVPVYTWDGEKWTTVPGSVGGKTAILSDGSIPMTAQLTVLNPPATPTDATAKAYVDASDAMAYFGLQFNGAMEINSTGLASMASSGYVIDGWTTSMSMPCATVAQAADAPAGFSTSLKWTNTVATVPAAASGYVLSHAIEGYRFSRVGFGKANPQPLTIGFWSKIHRPGMYSVGLRNSSPTDRSCVMPFTQNVADAWEYKTVTFPGCPDGVWSTNTAPAAQIHFAPACPPDRCGPAGVWSSASPTLLGVTGTTNGIAATTDTFQITGLIVLPGIYAPSAARSPFVMRPADVELQTCFRYFQRMPSGVNSFGLGQAVSPTRALIECPYPHGAMRGVPGIGFFNTFQLWAAGAGGLAVSAMTVTGNDDTRCMFDVTCASGLVAGNATRLVGAVAASQITFDARL
jgi:hypothetical protein